MLFLLRLIKIKVHLRQRRRTEKLGETARSLDFSEISRDSPYRQYVRTSFHVVRPPLVGRSVVGRSVLPWNFAAEKVVRGVMLGFFIGSSISFPVRRHPSVDGGNKAPNKRFPSRWTERTNGKSDISMPRRPPSSCYLLLPHRTLAVRPPPSLHPSLSILRPRPTPSPILYKYLSFIFSFAPSPSPPSYAFAHP